LETIFGPLNFDKNQPKSWNSTKRHLFDNAIGNFGLVTNSNLESTRNNSDLEYSTKYSTRESIEVDFEFFGLELVWTNFDMQSIKENSITQLLVLDFVEYVGVIMIGCVFIQTNKTTPKG
jgi:hypothetical protein